MANRNRQADILSTAPPGSKKRHTRGGWHAQAQGALPDPWHPAIWSAVTCRRFLFCGGYDSPLLT